MRQDPLIPLTFEDVCPKPRPRTAAERNCAPCGCDGSGQVHHGEGALSYVLPCIDRDCGLRRDALFMGVSHEDVERYFGSAA